MTIEKTHQFSPVPTRLEDWLLKVKEKRSLNDLVHDIHKLLLVDEALNEQYRAYLDAIWPEQTVEGSFKTDDTMAAIMIRERARIEDTPVQKEKISSIEKSLRVVLKRYHMGREFRRDTLNVESIPDDNLG